MACAVDHSASAFSLGSNANGTGVWTPVTRQICTCSSFSPHIREIYLSPLEAGEMLRSIETVTVVGLPNRALIGMMVFTRAPFAFEPEEEAEVE